MHCNLTHDKTYFEVFSFALCVVVCLCLGLVMLVLWAVLPVFVLSAVAADDELLVFVTVFVLGFAVVVLVVLVFDVDVFWLV